jgi:hypothetical protein
MPWACQFVLFFASSGNAEAVHCRSSAEDLQALPAVVLPTGTDKRANS